MDGILLIDKPVGLTSHDVVYKVRKILLTKQIGHTGTLDPNATGLLVLMVGRTTKLGKYFSDHDKEYEAEVILGLETNTDDLTGEVINRADASKLTDTLIRNELNRFVGESLQVPPAFSAIKVDGKKLYEYARKSQEIPEVEPRKITIKAISNLKIVERDNLTVTISFTCSVSKGTYIRALARDLGKNLGAYGTLKNLKRTSVGNFFLKDATSIEALTTGNVILLDPLPFLGMQNLTVKEDIKNQIDNGRFLPISLFKQKTDTIIYDQNHTPLAIYRFDSEKNIMRMSVKLL